MKKIFLLAFVIFGFCVSVEAQEFDQCGYDHLIKDIEKVHPGFTKHLDSQYLAGIRHISQQKLGKKENDTIYRIPVVFHVVYNTPLENVHDSLIESQMKVLNDAFRRKNEDTVNTRDLFKPLAGDTRIEFFLATEDPDGNPTDGIVRQTTTRTSFYIGAQTLTLDLVKSRSGGGADPWDTDKYLNIWVCDLSFNTVPILLGYAYPPTNATGWNQNTFVGKNRQGVVLHYGMVGIDNPGNNSGQNSTGEKTAVHEVGHYLGLRHIWGDGQAQVGCSLDDFIEDTPNTSSRNSACNKNRNTCNDGADDMPDMIENYMDYSPGTCVNMFTKMQSALMVHNLVELRAGLAEVEVPEPPVEPPSENKLYPTPTEDEITLVLKDIDPNKLYSIEITNTLGQLVHKKAHELEVMGTQIDASFLTSGFYYIEVRDGDAIIFKQKIVKY